MQYIESPRKETIKYPSVFLAGGITNCPDWQLQVRNLLHKLDITVVNPRRADFPIGNPKAAEGQIRWEYNALRRVDLVSFWFSQGSLNPIVLFELGSALERDIPIIIGIDPEYERRQDVLIQTQLRRPTVGIAIQESLGDLAASIAYLLRID